MDEPGGTGPSVGAPTGRAALSGQQASIGSSVTHPPRRSPLRRSAVHVALLATLALLTTACDFASLSQELTQADTSGAATTHDDGAADGTATSKGTDPGHESEDQHATKQHAKEQHAKEQHAKEQHAEEQQPAQATTGSGSGAHDHTGTTSAAAAKFDGELTGSGTPSVADPFSIPGPAVWFECDNTHEAKDDPIVHPGAPGAAHMHTFFGNPTTDAHSTTESLLAGPSSCDDTRNRSAYWFPQLRDGQGGKAEHWERTRAYYLKGAVDEVQPMPQGLRMIAGDPEPDVEQGVFGFACRPEHNPGDAGMPNGGRLSTDCPEGSNLSVTIVFPNCWDGEHLDSPDHRSHVRYDTDGHCPEGWVPIPQLRVSIATFDDTWHGQWVTGGPGTGHADFIEAAPKELMDDIVGCLNRTGSCPDTSFQ